MIALFDQHQDFCREQLLIVATLRHGVSELEFELGRRHSLEFEVERLRKLLTE